MAPLAGALPLTEAAKLSTDDLQRGVLETFVQESPVLDRLPFLTIQGNSYKWNYELALPSVAYRAVNEGYVGSTGTTDDRFASLVILGGDADVDRFIVQTRGDLNNQRAVQTAMKVKALSYKFQNDFVNGDVTVDPLAFDGLKKTVTRVVSSGTNGAKVFDPASDTVAHAFFDKLEELTAAVDGTPSAFYANASVIAKIRSAGRRMGGVEIVREDLTGKRITTWNGIPFLNLGTTPAGVQILPQTETKGTSNIASSIYAVRFGQNEEDGGVAGLTNGGVQVYDLGEIDSQPVYRTRIEFYCGLAQFSEGGAARLDGVLL
jgi:hypothetical protein